MSVFSSSQPRKQGILSRMLSRKSQPTTQAAQVDSGVALPTIHEPPLPPVTGNGLRYWNPLPEYGELETKIGRAPEWRSTEWDESQVFGWEQTLRAQQDIESNGTGAGRNRAWEDDVDWPSDWGSAREGENGFSEEEESEVDESDVDEREMLSRLEREREEWVRDYLPDDHAFPRINELSLEPRSRNPFLQPHYRDDRVVNGWPSLEPSRPPGDLRGAIHDVKFMRQQESEAERGRNVRIRKAAEERAAREQRAREARKEGGDRRNRELWNESDPSIPQDESRARQRRERSAQKAAEESVKRETERKRREARNADEERRARLQKEAEEARRAQMKIIESVRKQQVEARKAEARKERERKEQEARKAEEERRKREEKERDARRAREVAIRRQKDSTLAKIGAQVFVMKVNNQNTLVDGGRAVDLTPAILQQLSYVKWNFVKHLPTAKIVKIEYVLNQKLYKGFQDTKNQLKKHGKSTKEMLLFHGTRAENLLKYDY
jgi:hypothetical protein